MRIIDSIIALLRGESVRLPEGIRYRAFLSYRTVDIRVASWLHQSLEKYRVPRALVGQEGKFGPIPRRTGPIFRDRDDARTAEDIETLIRAELRRSEQLIVLCTPATNTFGSWVPREIEIFREQRPDGPIHAVIGAGEPPDVFPSSLRPLRADGSRGVPLAADLRSAKFGGIDGKRKAVVRVVAGILGTDFDRLWQRDRARVHRRAAGLAIAVCIGAAASVDLAYQSAWRESVLLANLSAEALTRGEVVSGLRLAVASVPPRGIALFHPTPPEASAALSLALNGIPLVAAYGDVTKPVWSLAMSDDSKRAVVASETGAVFVLDALRGRVTARIPPAGLNTSGTLSRVAIAPDGSLIASVDGVGRLRIFSGEGNLLAAQINTATQSAASYLSRVVFVRDGSALLAAAGNEIVVFDPKTANEQRRWKAHEAVIFHLLPSPDGSQILSCAADGTISLWETSTGTKQQDLAKHNNAILSCGFNGRGSQVYSSSPGVVRVHDLERGDVIGEWSGSAGNVTAARFAPDNSILAVGTGEGVVHFWAYAAHTTPKRVSMSGGAVRFLGYARGGRRLVAVSDGGFMSVWDSATQGLEMTVRVHSGRGENVVASSDGQSVLTVGNDNSPKLWATELTQEYEALLEDRQSDMSAGRLADGTLFGSVIKRRSLLIRHTGKDPFESVPPTSSLRRDEVTVAAISPDLSRLLLLWGDGRIEIRAPDGTTLASLEPAPSTSQHPNPTQAAKDDDLAPPSRSAGNTVGPPLPDGTRYNRTRGVGSSLNKPTFSTDGRIIAAIARDLNLICIWNALTGRFMLKLPDSGGADSIVFSSDGLWLVATDPRGSIGIWDTTSGRLITRVQIPAGLVQATISPDGNRIAISKNSGGSFLVSKDGGRTTDLEGPGYLVAFSPDGALAAGTTGRRLMVWRLADGREIASIGISATGPLFLAFSKSGSQIGIATQDGLRSWDISRATLQDTTAMRELACDQVLMNIPAFPAADISGSAMLATRPEIWNACNRQGLRDWLHVSSASETASNAPLSIEDTWPLNRPQLR